MFSNFDLFFSEKKIASLDGLEWMASIGDGRFERGAQKKQGLMTTFIQALMPSPMDAIRG